MTVESCHLGEVLTLNKYGWVSTLLEKIFFLSVSWCINIYTGDDQVRKISGVPLC